MILLNGAGHVLPIGLALVIYAFCVGKIKVSACLHNGYSSKVPSHTQSRRLLWSKSRSRDDSEDSALRWCRSGYRHWSKIRKKVQLLFSRNFSVKLISRKKFPLPYFFLLFISCYFIFSHNECPGLMSK